MNQDSSCPITRQPHIRQIILPTRLWAVVLADWDQSQKIFWMLQLQRLIKTASETFLLSIPIKLSYKSQSQELPACGAARIRSFGIMGRPKRNIFAAAEETSTPPSALTPTQSIAQVIKAEGNNLYSCSLPDQKKLLVELPSRFRNTIWIKRGGYVLIDTKDADIRQNKLDGEIINVVRDEHNWRKESYW